METPVTLESSSETGCSTAQDTGAVTGGLNGIRVTSPGRQAEHLGGSEPFNPASDLNADPDGIRTFAPPESLTCWEKVKAGIVIGIGTAVVGGTIGCIGCGVGAAIFGTATGAIICGVGLPAVVLLPLAGWFLYSRYKAPEPRCAFRAMPEYPHRAAVTQADRVRIDQAIDALKEETRARNRRPGAVNAQISSAGWNDIRRTLTGYVARSRAQYPEGNPELDFLAAAREMRDAMQDVLHLQRTRRLVRSKKVVKLAALVMAKVQGPSPDARTLMEAVKKATLCSLAAASWNQNYLRGDADHAELAIFDKIESHLSLAKEKLHQKDQSVEQILAKLERGSELRAVFLALAKLAHQNRDAGDEITSALHNLQCTLVHSLAQLAAPADRVRVQRELISLSGVPTSPTFDEDVAEAERLIWQAIPSMLIGGNACAAARREFWRPPQKVASSVPAQREELKPSVVAWQMIADINTREEMPLGLTPDDRQLLKSTIVKTMELHRDYCKNRDPELDTIQNDAALARTEIVATNVLSEEGNEAIRGRQLDGIRSSALNNCKTMVQAVQDDSGTRRDLIAPLTATLFAVYQHSAATNGGVLDDDQCREELDAVLAEAINSAEPTPKREQSRHDTGAVFEQLYQAVVYLSADHPDDDTVGLILDDLRFVLDKIVHGIESRGPINVISARGKLDRSVIDKSLRDDTTLVNQELFHQIPKLIAARTAFTKQLREVGS